MSNIFTWDNADMVGTDSVTYQFQELRELLPSQFEVYDLNRPPRVATPPGVKGNLSLVRVKELKSN